MDPHRRIFAILVAASLLGACGGGVGLRGGVYYGDETRYALTAPTGGWKSLHVGDQNDLAFYSSSLDAILQTNSTCSPSQDIPLIALTNHLLIGFTDRDYVSQDRVPMDQREALRTHVRAKLDGVPRELVLVVLKKDGCVYDFALIAPPGDRYTRAVPPFDAMLASFHAEAQVR